MAQEVARRCREASLNAPNPNTVRLRILVLPMRERLRRRSNRKEASDRFAPRPGTFDVAQRPLDIVQIDHTKLDIIVVDREQRLPIGRPWITLRSTSIAAWWLASASRSIHQERFRPGCASRTRCCPRKLGSSIGAFSANGLAGAFRRASIWTTPRSSTARCCGVRASSTESRSTTGRPRHRTWAVTSNGSWEPSHRVNRIMRREAAWERYRDTIAMRRVMDDPEPGDVRHIIALGRDDYGLRSAVASQTD
jgi:hypothetical protein